MPKPQTFPTLYDDALQLSISILKSWEYLEPCQNKSGTITWSRGDNPRGSISIKVNTLSNEPFIELDYKFQNQPRKYKVNLEMMPSNLGKGVIWFFICPQTNKRCRKLYSIGGYFFHREAFKGVMYESQTQSKKWREIEKICGASFDIDKYYQEIYSKHFKRFYNGKPTKKYLKIMEKIKQGESIPTLEIERLIIYGA
ncbi:hypothetical protein I2486_16105 [Cellulophaga sp. E16_2]|uniref:hypothetical protein n=1 Tax=Cellulophaga sp. E16_2 TaxID=2789297 RepID=UPI001A938BED|nr:hypothetical protein [Cellulophaga sp. E16_2]MBO0592928.1 hypothetical protein [Cellulophaga sp. E16_2]